MTKPLIAMAVVLAAAAMPAMAHDAMSEADQIKSAESAAPAFIGQNATIIGFDAEMKMVTLREGTNGFYCMPDTLETPGPDPMCVDEGGWLWTQAWMNQTEPPAGVVGFGYMLAGGSDADNNDPYSYTVPAGREWITTGPHVMVFNAPDMMKTYPTADQPDPRGAYVMWPNTPYAHTMLPVE